MLNKRMKTILTTGLLCSLLRLMPTVARAAEISDEGHFFSAEAIATANQSIHDLEKKGGHEVRIETFASVPAGKADAVAKMDAKERDAFFSKWVHERAETTKSRGILVLICREPSHFNVWAGTPLQQAGFGASQAKVVRETMQARLKAKEFDKALTETIAQLSKTFDGLSHSKASATTAPTGHPSKHIGQTGPTPSNHAPVHSAPIHTPQQSGWTGVIVVMMFVIGGIFVVSLIGRLFGGGRGYGSGGYGSAGPGYGGGGGFMSGLLGGVFGAVAGNWMYDQFSGHRAFGGESHSTGDTLGSSDSSGNSGIDSGTDTSDNGFSGGTDFGGGDFGGGDSGGGDFGGGGDF